MHTGALYLTPQDQDPVADCRRLHTYAIAIFLATFLFTLLGITVSLPNKWTRQEVMSHCRLACPLTCPLPHQALVVKARRIYRRTVTSCGYLGNQQRASFRVMDRRMLLYPLVFLLCWGPGERRLAKGVT